MADHLIVLTAKSGIRFVSISNDFNGLTVLPRPKLFGLMAYGSFADPFCRFNKETAQMRIPGFGNAQSVHVR